LAGLTFIFERYTQPLFPHRNRFNKA